MLLGAAKYLAETRDFDGTAVVVFQPAEEGGAGGLEMCRDGLMERFGIQEIYRMHNSPRYCQIKIVCYNFGADLGLVSIAVV